MSNRFRSLILHPNRWHVSRARDVVGENAERGQVWVRYHRRRYVDDAIIVVTDVLCRLGQVFEVLQQRLVQPLTGLAVRVVPINGSRCFLAWVFLQVLRLQEKELRGTSVPN